VSSKLLSMVLRHRPELIGIRLDEGGWADVDALLGGLAAHGKPMSRAQLERLVATSDKQRFALQGNRIRASQGHSVPVDLGLSPIAPPEVLFHGTPERNVEPILRQGLRRDRGTTSTSHPTWRPRYGWEPVAAGRRCCRWTPARCPGTAGPSCGRTTACGWSTPSLRRTSD
jgi:hypothetical protein